MPNCEPRVATATVKVNGLETKAIIDTGGCRSFVSERLTHQLNIATRQPYTGKRINAITGSHVDIKGVTMINLDMGKHKFQMECVVANNSSAPLLLGTEFFYATGAIPDIRNNKLNFPDGSNIDMNFVERETKPRNRVNIPLRTTTTVSLPPMRDGKLHECLIEVEGSPHRGPNATGMARKFKTGDGYRGDVAQGTTQLNHEGKGRLMIANLSTTETLHIDQGRIVAILEPMSEEEIVALLTGDDELTMSSVDSVDNNTINVANETEWNTEMERIQTQLTHITSEDGKVEDLLELLGRYKSVFDETDTNRVATGVEHTIDTGDAKPIAIPLRRTTPEKNRVIEEEVKRMQREKIIRSSNSSWAAPVHIVPKPKPNPDGTKGYRFCIDYRQLNKITKSDAYPPANIDDALEALGNNAWFSVFDCKAAYHSIPVAEKDKPKTAFRWKGGLFEFERMPFGLKTAPATFQRFMDALFAGVKWHTVMVYLDDIIVFSRSYKQHLQDVEEVLRRLHKSGLSVNLSKCHFACKEVQYLGYTVKQGQISPSKHKSQAIDKFPRPTSITQVQQFLGLAGHFRRFVEKFAGIADPLRKLKDPKKWEWTDECETSFQTLKAVLTSTPVLRIADRDKKFYLTTDASKIGLGAVLTQKDDNGGEYVIEYASRRLHDVETRYSATELELLAVVWAGRKFRHYLEGTTTELFTDHRPLIQIIKNEAKTPGNRSTRLEKYALHMQDFDFEPKYIPGKTNVLADALSRNPVDPAPDLEGIKLDAIEKMAKDVEEEDALVALMTTPETENEMRTPGALPMAEFQRRDDTLGPVIRALEGGHEIEDKFWNNLRKRLILKRSKLFIRHGRNALREGEVNEGHKELLVIPELLQPLVLANCHDDITSGHLAYKKTLKRINEFYWWRNVKTETKEWTRTCHKCQIQQQPRKDTGLLQEIPPPDKPMDTISMDIVGPFNNTPRGNKYILNVIDHLTRYIWLIPIRGVDATTVAKTLVTKVLLQAGIPARIVSDQGSHFANQTMSALLRELETKHHMTLTYHHQANGINERPNGPLKDMISKYCDGDRTDWDIQAPYFAFALNSSAHDTTETPPFTAMYGRTVKTPLAMKLGLAEGHTDNLHVGARMQIAWELARINTKKRHDRSARSYNRNKRDVFYGKGNKVLLLRTEEERRRTGRTDVLWDGPFTITRRENPVVYEIARNKRGRGDKTLVHVNRLKRYHEREQQQEQQDNIDEDADFQGRGAVAGEAPTGIHVIVEERSMRMKGGK